MEKNSTFTLLQKFHVSTRCTWQPKLGEKNLDFAAGCRQENVVDFVYIRFEISGDPCNLIGSNWCDLFTYRNNRSDFKVFFKVTNRIAGKWKTNFG